MAETPIAHAHQFDSMEHQHETSYLGMWLFLGTEVMFFGGLFVAYAVYRYLYPAAFAEGSSHTNLLLGSINTGILLVSSLMMALAVRAAQLDQRRLLVLFLLLTIVFGTIFLGIKGYEYYHEYQEGLVPGIFFTYTGEHAAQVALFFVFYFFMTGLHAVHMTIGLGVVAVIAFLAWRGKFSSAHYTPVEGTGLYWHFVDMVWVFLYPLLYLIN